MTSATTPRIVSVNGVELHYIEAGAGDPVVFAHGGLSDYRGWPFQLEPFAAHYRVIMYSQRYYWPNPRPSDLSGYTTADHAADLAALIETRGLAPAFVVGTSYGAYITLTMAIA